MSVGSEQPIGQRNTVPISGSDQGEHGAGFGVSSGYDHKQLSSDTPIANKFMSNTSHMDTTGDDSYSALRTGLSPLSGGVTGAIDREAAGTQGAPLGEAVGASKRGSTGLSETGFSHESRSSTVEAVSGAYEGGVGFRGDALTGQVPTHRVGESVGVLGENAPHRGTAGAAALASTAGGAAAALGGHTGTGVGPSGGSGGHYRDVNAQRSGAPGTTGEPNTIGGEYGAGSIAGGPPGTTSPTVGATGTTGRKGPLNAGATGAADTAASENVPEGAKTGRFGTGDDHTRGEPLSDPKDIDTGGPHSLVFQESTGKYVHRHEHEVRK